MEPAAGVLGPFARAAGDLRQRTGDLWASGNVGATSGAEVRSGMGEILGQELTTNSLGRTSVHGRLTEKTIAQRGGSEEYQA